MKRQLSRLLIVNQVMQPNHPALSHQIDAVRQLSSCFESIQVLTGKQASELPSSWGNINISSFRLENNFRLANLFSFYLHFFRILINFKPQTIFCHMATTESLLISPISKLLNIRHILWYAHKSLPWQLRLTVRLIDNIVTSTAGSCPITGPKVKFIGQGIDSTQFYSKRKKFSSLNNIVHVGRLDYSKGIHIIFQVAEDLASLYGPVSLEFIGSPLRHESNKYLLETLDKASNNRALQVKITDAIPRNKLRDCFENKDLFIHAYEGSLDKVLIEATLADLPVVTLNEEFNKHFFSPRSLSEGSLLERVIAWHNMTDNEKRLTMKKRREVALTKHSLENWAKKLSQLLH